MSCTKIFVTHCILTGSVGWWFVSPDNKAIVYNIGYLPARAPHLASATALSQVGLHSKYLHQVHSGAAQWAIMTFSKKTYLKLKILFLSYKIV